MIAPGRAALVKDSFRAIVALGDPVVEAFYAELSVLDPSFRLDVDGDRLRQRKRLLSGLAFVVRSLLGADRVAATELSVVKFADEYRLVDNVDLVSVALVRSLKKALGDDFKPELHEVWIEALKAAAGRANVEAS